MRSYKVQAVILKRQKFGEADLILTVFSKKKGKIRVIAKGVRKPTSRKGGNLELFNLAKISVSSGRNLDLVTEAETISSFKAWKRDLTKVARAYQYCELVDKLSAEEVPNEKVFFHLEGALEALSEKREKDFSQEFELKLLEELGFWPKGKSFAGANPEDYIEGLIERKLKSRQFLRDVKDLQIG